MLSAEAIAGGNVPSVNYFIADEVRLKALEAHRDLVRTTPRSLILPDRGHAESWARIAGIGEIAKAAFGQDGAPPRPPSRGGSVPSAGG